MLEPMKPKERFLEDIREKMRELRISQTAIGEHIFVHQPDISKIFSGGRRLRYDEAEQIVSYIFGKMSVIPPESKAYEKATKEEELMWAYSDEKMKDVSKRMFCKGYSQMPIRDRASNEFMGVISELSIIKKMVRPDLTLEQLRETTIKNAGIIESLIRIPNDNPTLELAQILINAPAILVEERLKITGIFTRSDMLKFLFTD